jgi:hypothetical protein
MKKLTAASVIIAMSLGFATTSFAEGDGGCERACGSQSKGNNGWGNGGDTTNAGSDAGPTSETKLPSVER